MNKNEILFVKGLDPPPPKKTFTIGGSSHPLLVTLQARSSLIKDEKSCYPLIDRFRFLLFEILDAVSEKNKKKVIFSQKTLNSVHQECGNNKIYNQNRNSEMSSLYAQCQSMIEEYAKQTGKEITKI